MSIVKLVSCEVNTADLKVALDAACCVNSPYSGKKKPYIPNVFWAFDTDAITLVTKVAVNGTGFVDIAPDCVVTTTTATIPNKIFKGDSTRFSRKAEKSLVLTNTAANSARQLVNKIKTPTVSIGVLDYDGQEPRITIVSASFFAYSDDLPTFQAITAANSTFNVLNFSDTLSKILPYVDTQANYYSDSTKALNSILITNGSELGKAAVIGANLFAVVCCDCDLTPAAVCTDLILPGFAAKQLFQLLPKTTKDNLKKYADSCVTLHDSAACFKRENAEITFHWVRIDSGAFPAVAKFFNTSDAIQYTVDAEDLIRPLERAEISLDKANFRHIALTFDGEGLKLETKGNDFSIMRYREYVNAFPLTPNATKISLTANFDSLYNLVSKSEAELTFNLFQAGTVFVIQTPALKTCFSTINEKPFDPLADLDPADFAVDADSAAEVEIENARAYAELQKGSTEMKTENTLAQFSINTPPTAPSENTVKKDCGPLAVVVPPVVPNAPAHTDPTAGIYCNLRLPVEHPLILPKVDTVNNATSFVDNSTCISADLNNIALGKVKGGTKLDYLHGKIHFVKRSGKFATLKTDNGKTFRKQINSTTLDGVKTEYIFLDNAWQNIAPFRYQKVDLKLYPSMFTADNPAPATEPVFEITEVESVVYTTQAHLDAIKKGEEPPIADADATVIIGGTDSHKTAPSFAPCDLPATLFCAPTDSPPADISAVTATFDNAVTDTVTIDAITAAPVVSNYTDSATVDTTANIAPATAHAPQFVYTAKIRKNKSLGVYSNGKVIAWNDVAANFNAVMEDNKQIAIASDIEIGCKFLFQLPEHWTAEMINRVIWFEGSLENRYVAKIPTPPEGSNYYRRHVEFVKIDNSTPIDAPAVAPQVKPAPVVTPVTPPAHVSTEKPSINSASDAVFFFLKLFAKFASNVYTLLANAARAKLFKNTERPCDSYSFGNLALLAWQGATDARGFNAWLKVKRHVSKGAKALYIFAPILKTVKSKDSEGNEIEKKVPISYKRTPVFDISQTEGNPLTFKDIPEITIDTFANAAANFGYELDYYNAPAFFYDWARALSDNDTANKLATNTLCKLIGWADIPFAVDLEPLKGDNDNKSLNRICKAFGAADKIVSTILTAALDSADNADNTTDAPAPEVNLDEVTDYVLNYLPKLQKAHFSVAACNKFACQLANKFALNDNLIQVILDFVNSATPPVNPAPKTKKNPKAKIAPDVTFNVGSCYHYHSVNGTQYVKAVARDGDNMFLQMEDGNLLPAFVTRQKVGNAIVEFSGAICAADIAPLKLLTSSLKLVGVDIALDAKTFDEYYAARLVLFQLPDRNITYVKLSSELVGKFNAKQLFQLRLAADKLNAHSWQDDIAWFKRKKDAVNYFNRVSELAATHA